MSVEKPKPSQIIREAAHHLDMVIRKHFETASQKAVKTNANEDWEEASYWNKLLHHPNPETSTDDMKEGE